MLFEIMLFNFALYFFFLYMGRSVEYVEPCYQPNQEVPKKLCFCSGSDRKVPTQAYQPIVLIKQLYSGSTFLLTKYSEVNHHTSLSLFVVFFFLKKKILERERERGNITIDDKMGHFLSQVAQTMNLGVQPIHHNAWPKCSTKFLPMHKSIRINWRVME